MTTITKKTLSTYPISKKTLSTEQGSIVDYTEVVSKVFVGPDMDAIKLIVNESEKVKVVLPEYSEGVDYEQKVSFMEEFTTKNIDLLKRHCLDVNLLSDQYKNSTNDDIKSISDACTDFKRSKCSNTENGSFRPNKCPYHGCNKAYTASTSLKLHIKKNHKAGDRLKEDVCGNSNAGLLRAYKRGIDLEKVFKKDCLSKIRNKFGLIGFLEASTSNEAESRQCFSEIPEIENNCLPGSRIIELTNPAITLKKTESEQKTPDYKGLKIKTKAEPKIEDFHPIKRKYSCKTILKDSPIGKGGRSRKTLKVEQKKRAQVKKAAALNLANSCVFSKKEDVPNYTQPELSSSVIVEENQPKLDCTDLYDPKENPVSRQSTELYDSEIFDSEILYNEEDQLDKLSMDFEKNHFLEVFKKDNLFEANFNQFDEDKMHEDLIFGDSMDYKLSYSRITGDWEEEALGLGKINYSRPTSISCHYY